MNYLQTVETLIRRSVLRASDLGLHFLPITLMELQTTMCQTNLCFFINLFIGFATLLGSVSSNFLNEASDQCLYCLPLIWQSLISHASNNCPYMRARYLWFTHCRQVVTSYFRDMLTERANGTNLYRLHTDEQKDN